MELDTLSTQDINDMTLEDPDPETEPAETEETIVETETDSADVSADEESTEGNETIDVEEVFESIFDSYFSQAEEVVKSTQPVVLAAPAPSGRVDFGADDLLYRLEINDAEYSVLFPADSRALLAVNNGYLINTGSSNITGVVLLSGDQLSISDYHQKFYTLYPITQTTAQNNLYRYNASGYLTTYSPSTGNNLTTTLSYGNAEVIEKPGIFSGYQQYQLIVMAALALLIVIQFINGLFRR